MKPERIELRVATARRHIEPGGDAAGERRRPSLLAAILPEIPLIVLVASYAIVGAVSSHLFEIPPDINWSATWTLLGFFSLLYLGGAALVMLVHTVVVRGESLRSRDTWRSFARRLVRPRRILNTLAVLATMAILMQVFFAFKWSIPLIQPFSWDATFMRLDRWLHFGRHPYELLHGSLGRPAVTWTIDRAYFLWIHVMWFTLAWQIWHGSNRRLRSQYLLSFAGCWILLGTVAAILLSSAGPIFFGQVTAVTDPYQPLMEYLRLVDQRFSLRVFFISDYLWTAYSDPGDGIVGGISAMPSLHIAIVVLQTLLGFSVSRWLGWAYATFAVVIFLGSIHLGWHYAIDGYVSAIAVAGIWWVSGRIAEWTLTDASLQV